MKRRKKLKNRRWLRSRPKVKRTKPARKSKHARRERFVPYMLAVKSLSCAALDIPGHVCDGSAIEADHAGNRFTAGDGTRAHDSTCIPLCRLAHQQRHAFSGIFAGWTGEQMRTFLDGCIARTQRCLHARGVAVPTPNTLAPLPRESDPIVLATLREDGNVDVRHPEAIEGNRR